MKYYLIISLLICIMIAGCSKLGKGKEADAFVAQIVKNYPELDGKKYEVATIKRVVDGDTFETESGRKIRLIGVNTPEIHGKVQYYGREARDFSKRRLEKQTVYLFSDVSETDRYGRLLRYLFIQDNPVMFNETLLTEGYANTMTIPSDVMFAETFKRLEREAREKRKGLWGKSGQDQGCAEPKIKGNINSWNEKIYHVPGSKYYEQTKAEKMFCTEEEAIAAGFRKARE